MPQNTSESQPRFFDECLHVPDYHVINLLIENANEIPGFSFLLRYAKFILEKSAGHINRQQWHCRKTIMEAMGMKAGNNLSRYEDAWIKSGWLLKIESKGRVPSKRLLGPRFDEIRKLCSMPSNRIQFESSNPIQFESSNPIQFESTNPNNLKHNEIKLHSDDEEERSHKDASSSLNEVSSPSYEIVSLSKRLERFYVTKRGDPAAYDWLKANKASERLLARGIEYVEKLINHLEENYPSNRFYVSESMWESLCCELDSAKSSEIKVEYDYEEDFEIGIDPTPF